MTDKPENFVITSRADSKIVERHFELPGGDFISYRQTIKCVNDPTIRELHRMSADLVIRHLLQYLPEGYGVNGPYLPGEKK